MPLLARHTKQPDDVLDYSVDYTEWFDGRTGDAIDQYTVTADPGISILTHRREGMVITVVLAGGTASTAYKITVRITTLAGLAKEADFSVAVRAV